MASNIPVDRRDFLGTGLGTPVQIDPRTGGVSMISSAGLVEESIIRIIQTSRGSRIMNRTFGSDVNDILFEPADMDTITDLADAVEQAIYEHEPRVQSLRVTPRVNGTTIYIGLDYTVIGETKPTNLVFPFYLEETI